MNLGENCPKELKREKLEKSVLQEQWLVKNITVCLVQLVTQNSTMEKNYFHRMGDLGYYDENGLLRFMGRKVERVITKDGPLETERCEPLVNAMKNISRSALIGIGRGKNQRAMLGG